MSFLAVRDFLRHLQRRLLGGKIVLADNLIGLLATAIVFVVVIVGVA